MPLKIQFQELDLKFWEQIDDVRATFGLTQIFVLIFGMRVLGSNKMTPKREAFVRCCERIAKHFADKEEQSDEEDYHTDYSSDGSLSSVGSFLTDDVSHLSDRW